MTQQVNSVWWMTPEGDTLYLVYDDKARRNNWRVVRRTAEGGEICLGAFAYLRTALRAIERLGGKVV